MKITQHQNPFQNSNSFKALEMKTVLLYAVSCFRLESFTSPNKQIEREIKFTCIRKALLPIVSGIKKKKGACLAPLPV
jgi:hypothetical protein